MTYSEHELEFTFAKNLYTFLSTTSLYTVKHRRRRTVVPCVRVRLPANCSVRTSQSFDPRTSTSSQSCKHTLDSEIGFGVFRLPTKTHSAGGHAVFSISGNYRLVSNTKPQSPCGLVVTLLLFLIGAQFVYWRFCKLSF